MSNADTTHDLRSTQNLAARARRFATPVRWVSLAIIVVSLLLLARALPLEQGVEVLRGWIAGLGVWSYVVYALVYVVATVLLLPGTILTVAAGAAFGLVMGTVTVSVGSTAGAAAAFLIARYLGRDRVARRIERYPKFKAIDKAIGEEGWKIVGLLRLSPVVPFNLQNYLYGLTGIGFWEAVITSWLAMLPGTFMYVYFGYLGRAGVAAAADAGESAGAGPWALRIVGLLATVAVTVYVTRIATRAVKRHTAIDDAAEGTASAGAAGSPPAAEARGWPWGAGVTALLALALAATAAWATRDPGAVERTLAGLFGPPRATLGEAYADTAGSASFDHAPFDELLRRHVDADGWVDYEGLRADADRLDAYIEALAAAPFGGLGRDGKLALLINAYNAFTLKLILERYPLESIRDIPGGRRWDDERWTIGGRVYSLNQIEHEQIRPKFREPRIHFALVCAAIGCPPLRDEAYTATAIDRQLDEQTRYVHARDRWFRFDAAAGVVGLTRLYDWYGGDFEQVAGSALDYAARYAPALSRALEAGSRPKVRWLDYDWKLNDVKNRTAHQDASDPEREAS